MTTDKTGAPTTVSRRHPSRPPGPEHEAMRVESEYRRHGTLAYLAAYDVHRAHVIGHCASSTGIEPFSALVDKVMTRQPFMPRRGGCWVVDNGRLAPRLDRCSTALGGVFERDHDPPARARVMAQPD